MKKYLILIISLMLIMPVMAQTIQQNINLKTNNDNVILNVNGEEKANYNASLNKEMAWDFTRACTCQQNTTSSIDSYISDLIKNMNASTEIVLKKYPEIMQKNTELQISNEHLTAQYGNCTFGLNGTDTRWYEIYQNCQGKLDQCQNDQGYRRQYEECKTELNKSQGDTKLYYFISFIAGIGACYLYFRKPSAKNPADKVARY